MRMTVVLPQPDGPTKTTNSPSLIVSVERLDHRASRPCSVHEDLGQRAEFDERRRWLGWHHASR